MCLSIGLSEFYNTVFIQPEVPHFMNYLKDNNVIETYDWTIKFTIQIKVY